MPMLKRLRFGPIHAQLVVTRFCNLSCGYCNEFDKVSDPVPKAELIRRIDKLKDFGTLSLEFTGGEPLSHPDMFSLIAHATSRRFIQRMMISNAYLLNAEKVRALNDAGLTHLQVSLDGVTPNDVTVKVLKPLRPKLAALAEHAKFKVTLSAVVGAAPPAEVLEIVEFAEQHGFTPRVLLIHDGQGQLTLPAEQRQFYAELRTRLGSRWNDAHDYRSELLEGRKAPFKCRAGSRYLYVDEFGKIRWCSQTRDLFEKDLLTYGWNDLEQQFLTQKPCSDTCTVGCARNDSKLDEWRAQPLPSSASVHLRVVP